MGQSSHGAELVDTQDPNEAGADTLGAPAKDSPPGHGWGQATIEDFYREGMGVAGKE